MGRIGFVTQDDVLFPHLTVKETITYAARLRLSKTLTKQEKEKQAADVICELGLERYLDTSYFLVTFNYQNHKKVLQS